MQEFRFSAKEPWTLPPQKVPATAQQILPPATPLLIPSKEVSVAAGHSPRSATGLLVRRSDAG
jgi:hypothetical protein